MGDTASIGGVSFAALDSTDGRKCLEAYADSFTYDIKRFHVPGVAGNYIVRGGRNGGRITVVARYIGTKTTVRSYIKSDKDAWENAAVSITIPEATYTRCQLDSARITAQPRPMGRGGGSKVFIDVTYTFTRDS